MPLTMRPAGLSSGIDQDRPDYTVVTGEWEVGRIYQTRGGPDSLRWFWSMTVNGPMTRSALVGNPGRGQGAASGELGRLEGMGDAGRGAIDLRCRPRRRPRRSGKKTPLQVGPERGFQRAVRLRLGTSWTPNRASGSR